MILSAEGNGTLTEFVEYSVDFPFLIIRSEKLSSRNRKIAIKFNKMMDFLEGLPRVNRKYSNRLRNKFNLVQKFQSEVAGKTIDHEYNMKEKLLAISITGNNFEVCEAILLISKEMDKIREEVIEAVQGSVEKARISPNSEILASRGLQAANEGLRDPKDIVQKFWPMV